MHPVACPTRPGDVPAIVKAEVLHPGLPPQRFDRAGHHVFGNRPAIVSRENQPGHVTDDSAGAPRAVQ